jgi:hypothetical protein
VFAYPTQRRLLMRAELIRTWQTMALGNCPLYSPKPSTSRPPSITTEEHMVVGPPAVQSALVETAQKQGPIPGPCESGGY